MMNWYIAKIAYGDIGGDVHHSSHFDEQLHLVQPDTKTNVFLKSRQVGKIKEDVFFNTTVIYKKVKHISSGHQSEIFELT